MSANSLITLGGAEGDRTPDPKTASTFEHKITILEISPGFPFNARNQWVDCFILITSITMIMPFWIFFSTNLAQ
jgi:hypothetical protein